MIFPIIHVFIDTDKGGGVTIAVRNGIVFKVRNDLEFFNSETESIFIEVKKKTYLVLHLI